MVPKITPLPYRKVDQVLRRHGFVVERQTGSHVIYAHADGRSTVVPRHGRDVGRGLLLKVLAQAGIEADEVRR